VRRLLSPICLVLALSSIIAGFAMLAVGEPEAGMELHRARVAGEEQYEELLEARLEKRRWSRKVMIGGLFASAVFFTAAGFATMGSGARRAGGRRPAA
jgi:hypothetical protein